MRKLSRSRISARAIKFEKNAQGIDQLYVDNKLASAGAYNNWISDFQAADRSRLVIAAYLNLRDINKALKELDLRLKQSFKGAFLAPERVDGRAFASDYFDPLWARIGDWYDTLASRTFTFALGATLQLMPACMAMVVDGLFNKFPKLKLVAIEAGCRWTAYAMDRLGEKYKHFSTFDKKLELENSSDYFRHNLWFVAEPEERTIGSMLELVGADRILWGSDFPRIDADLEATSHIVQMC